MRRAISATVLLLLLPAAFAQQAPELSPYLPELAPWKLVKGDEGSAMLGSEVPRVPELLYQRYVSAAIPPVIATPLVEGDRIFIADAGGIYALNASTGELLWGLDIAAVASAPAGGAGAYVELERNKRARQGWDVAKWRFLPVGTGLTYFSYGAGKHVYIATAATQPDVTGPYEEPMLIAIDKSTGEVLWKKKFGRKESSARGNLLVSGGRVCAASEDKVYCFTEDGREAWSAQLSGGSVIGLAASEGVLYATTPGTAEEKAALYAFDLRSGKLLWKHVPEYGGMSAPLAKKGMVFYVSTGTLKAVSKEGKLLWENNVGIPTDIYDNAFIAAGESALYAVNPVRRAIFVVSYGGNITGSFTFEEEEQPAGAPVVAGDVVLLPVVKEFTGGSDYSRIYLLWRGTAKLHELSFPVKEYPNVKVSAAKGRVYVIARAERRGEVEHLLAVYGDEEAPVIREVTDVRRAHDNESVKISATLGDRRSAIYKALLFYSVNGSVWRSVEMAPERRYVMEPIGGYGFEEEPFSASIPAQPAGSEVRYAVAAIDSVGNYALSEVKSYVVTPAEAEGEAGEEPATAPPPERGACAPTMVVLMALAPLALRVLMRRWQRGV